MQFQKITYSALVALGLSTSSLFAQGNPPIPPSSQALYETLKAHPELLEEALSRVQKTYGKKPRPGKSPYQEKNDRVRSHQEEVYQAEGYPFLGPKEAPHVVVLFSDPQCGYCHGLLKDLVAYTKEHQDVKFILKDIPFMGPLSDRLSEQAMIAAHQGRFEGWLETYLAHTGPMNDKTLKAFGTAGGVDGVTAPPHIQGKIEAAKALAKKLGIHSTPTFVLDGRVYEDYRGLAPFSELIDRRLRRGGEGKSSSNPGPI